MFVLFKNTKGERIEKIKMRKNYLLKTFSKSNSHHDFEKIYNLSNDSNEIYNNISSNNYSQKNIKLFLKSSPKAGTSFNSKKLTPSSISRAKFYDEFYEDVEENKQIEQDALFDSIPKKAKENNAIRNLNNYLSNSIGNDKDFLINDGILLAKSLKSKYKNSHKGIKICPRYTLSQEKNNCEHICNTEINNNCKINLLKNRLNKTRKRIKNNSHHNLNPNLNINILNSIDYDENLNYNKERLNIKNINWENEKESLNIGEDIKIKNLHLVKGQSEHRYYQLINNKKSRADRDIFKRAQQIDKDSNRLQNNIEYENINLVSLISSDSDENSLNYEKIDSNNNQIQRKLSFIENIEVEENSNYENILIKRNKSEINIEEKKNENTDHIYYNKLNQNFCEDDLDCEFNIICGSNKSNLSNKEKQDIKIINKIEEDDNGETYDRQISNQKENSILDNPSFINEEAFCSGSDSKKINTSVIIPSEENDNKSYNKSNIDQNNYDDFETCNFQYNKSKEVFKNNNFLIESNNLLNFQFIPLF